jgi:dTDP-glucose 4,6-dehydratase
VNILIIGGTGFISNRLAARLLDAQHRVSIMTRGHTPVSEAARDRLEVLTCDRHDAKAFSDILAGRTFDIAIDMIAYEPKESEKAIAVLRGKVGRFIHCSTVSVYMVSEQAQCPITEDQDKLALMKFFPRNPFGMEYGMKKRECEDVLWSAHDDRMFPVSMVRPTYVSGPGDPAKRDYFWIERILDGGPLLVPGTGDDAFQGVYVEDVVSALEKLVANPRTVGKAYNVASEQIFSLDSYLNELAALLGKSVDLVHVPQEIFDTLPFSTSPEGDVFPFNTRRDAVFSLEKIKQDLDYRSTPFGEWMPKTIEWFVNRFVGHSNGYSRRPEELKFLSRG